MKKIFSTGSNDRINNLWLLILRVSMSAFLLTHGLSKLTMLIEGNGATFPDPLGVGNKLSLVLAVLGEVGGPVLIIPGIITRLATIPTLITMSVAAFIVHGSDPFKIREMALLYLIGFLTVLILGPGRYSIDNLINKK